MDTIWFQTLVSILILFCFKNAWFYIKRFTTFKASIEKFPGPKTLPILGNTLDFRNHAELINIFLDYQRRYPKFCRFWLGFHPFILLYNAQDVEKVLTSRIHIEKSMDYNFLIPWLGTGLLTSGGSKWHNRRKLLTPSFHFQILDNFLEVFNEQSKIFVSKLSNYSNDIPFDISHMVTLCTLDIICDSVMGRLVDAQQDSGSAFVKATEKIKDIIHERTFTFWLWPDFLFKLSSGGKEHANCLKILHEFSAKVIEERKRVRKLKEKPSLSSEDLLFKRKPRLAFLDLLFETSDDGRVLSNSDIQEEVDTFMFEGHDTTSAGITWTLYLLGRHPHIQEKVYNELLTIFGEDKERNVTMQDVAQLKYLECVIKEALRIYPSVPFVGRTLNDDFKLEDVTIPKGATVVVVMHLLHRDPNVFPNPEIFDPDRFSAENIKNRHPFAYVPFSAGPRNCIGQKFALLEEKVVLANILRSYSIESQQSPQDIQLLAELILTSKNGIIVRVSSRK